MADQRGLVEGYQSSVLSEEESARINGERTFKTDLFDSGTDLRDIADRAMPVICKMLETGVRGRQNRFEAIRKNEDMYNGSTPPALRGRSNVPFDCIVMGGFIDTLMANIDEPIDLSFGPARESATKAAKKMTAVFKEEAGPTMGNWDDQITNSKFLASLSGRGFSKLNIESAPKFKTDFSVPDHYDMVTEPQGGAYLDLHLFKFEMNIFRTKGQMLDAARNGFYDIRQVGKLVSRYSDPEYKRNDDAYRNKLARFAVFGVDIEAEGYVGQDMYRLTEGVVSINGQWFYTLFSFETQTWVRFQRLVDVFPWAERYQGRGAWTSWATHRHPFVFWTKAPADDIRAVAYTTKKILNLTIDEMEKNIWDMKAYDPRIFTDPTALLYKQDSLVRATLRQGQKIQDGIYRFQTGDHSSITVNMMQYLDAFLGKNTGITDDARGDTAEKMVGLQVNNIAQVSKRMTRYNRQYAQMYNDLGNMFDLGVKKRIRESRVVKLIGLNGADWDETFTPEDASQEFKLVVKAGIDDAVKSAQDTSKRKDFFDSIETNPGLQGKVNASAMIRLKGRDAGFDEETIDGLLDLENDSDADILADAAQAIEDCLADKPYRLYRDANVAFVEKIVNFAKKHYQVIPTGELKKMPRSKQKEYEQDMKEYDRLMELVQMHMPFVKRNAARDSAALQASQGGAPAPNRISPDLQAAMSRGGKGGGSSIAEQPQPQQPVPAQ